jgi:hypothetical protein
MFCVQVAALRRDDPPSKKSCRLCIGFISELILNENRPQSLIRQGTRRRRRRKRRRRRRKRRRRRWRRRRWRRKRWRRRKKKQLSQ